MAVIDREMYDQPIQELLDRVERDCIAAGYTRYQATGRSEGELIYALTNATKQLLGVVQEAHRRIDALVALNTEMLRDVEGLRSKATTYGAAQVTTEPLT